MKFSIFFVSFLLSISLFAKPEALVDKLKGDVQFNGKKLSMNDVVSEDGVLKVGPRSFVRVLVKKWNNTIVLGPNSEMSFKFSDAKSKKFYTFEKGTCRWKTLLKSNGKGKGMVFTKTVSMGVRGTDYLLTVNPDLGESEIVVLEGKVEMTDLAKKKFILISEGQWGGLGGRFGQELKGPIDLPPTFLDREDKKLKFK